MKAYQTLIFLCSVLLLVVGICLFFPKDGVEVFGKVLRFPSLEEAMTKKVRDTESADEKLARAEKELKLKIEQDSLIAANNADSLLYVDSLKSYQKLVFETTARIECPNNDVSILYPLFDALDQCAKGKEAIHILHYGDSQIEQDRITGYIREGLQTRFGGYGAGLVPVIQPIQSLSVEQSCSDSLPRYIADGTMKQKMSSDHYGVLAQVAMLRGGSAKVRVAARNWKQTFSHVRKFSKVSLLVGNTGENFSVTLSYSDKDTTITKTEADPDISYISWQLDDYINKFTLKVSGTAELYAIEMGSKSGVFVTNIPLRGSSGTFFTKISTHLLSSSMKALDTRLIMLEFGGNATPYIKNDKAVDFYKKSISRQIAHLRSVYPSAAILFIGPADMATRIDGELQSYPYLEKTIQALREVAAENGAMFWNMYGVMGGKNSMLKWVEHSPAWAGSDYVHFTERGANKIAEVFLQSFMNTYDYYNFLKRNEKWSGIK